MRGSRWTPGYNRDERQIEEYYDATEEGRRVFYQAEQEMAANKVKVTPSPPDLTVVDYDVGSLEVIQAEKVWVLCQALHGTEPVKRAC
eukprot:m.424466 g.424466  ORF g.424466 m.424466 type:complete len:88 (+) comp16856_c0_seq61:620-883(+)